MVRNGKRAPCSMGKRLSRLNEEMIVQARKGGRLIFVTRRGNSWRLAAENQPSRPSRKPRPTTSSKLKMPVSALRKTIPQFSFLAALGKAKFQLAFPNNPAMMKVVRKIRIAQPESVSESL